MEPDHENPWAEYGAYFDADGLAEYLGTSVDAIRQAITAGAVLYLVTGDAQSIMPAAQFSDAKPDLVPRLSEMTKHMDPAREDPAGVLIWALAPQRALGGRTPIEVLRSSEDVAIAQLMASAARIGALAG